MAVLLVRSRTAAVFYPESRAVREVGKLIGGPVPTSEGYLHSLPIGKGAFISLGNAKHCSSTRDVFKLTLETEELQIERQNSLIEKRSSPGAVLFEGKVLVFGGVQYPKEGAGLKTLATAEELDVSSDEPDCCWHGLPPMVTPRAFFTPCVYNSQVYLCGGLTPYCERYCPSSCSYTPLWVSLYEFDGYAHSTFLYEGEIVILSQHWMTRWKPEGVETRSEELEEIGDVGCRVGPILCGEFVFLGTKEGIKVFNVDRMEGAVVHV